MDHDPRDDLTRQMDVIDFKKVPFRNWPLSDAYVQYEPPGQIETTGSAPREYVNLAKQYSRRARRRR